MREPWTVWKPCKSTSGKLLDYTNGPGYWPMAEVSFTWVGCIELIWCYRQLFDNFRLSVFNVLHCFHRLEKKCIVQKIPAPKSWNAFFIQPKIRKYQITTLQDFGTGIHRHQICMLWFKLQLFGATTFNISTWKYVFQYVIPYVFTP